MPIRRHLLILAFTLLVPGLFACGLAVLLTYSYERQSSEDNLLRTTRALAESTDRRLEAIAARLEALSTSPSLRQGDLGAFRVQARRAVRDEGFWVVLIDRDGQQVLNTLRPMGAALPRHGPDDIFTRVLHQVLRTGRPALSDLFIGPVTGKPTLALSVPVTDDQGRIAYVLAVGIDPGALGGLVSSSSLPAHWLVGVFDTRLAMVARSRGAEAAIGKQPVPALAEAMRAAEAGVTDAVSREGINTRVAFSRSPIFGWWYAVGVPTSDMAASVYRTLLIFGAGVAVMLALGVMGAMAVGRRISGAIGMLVPAAAALRAGKHPAYRATGVDEVDAVALALEKTGGELQASEAERRRAEASMKAAKERAEDILASITDGFYALDGNWRFTYINPRAQRILGKSPDEVLGRAFFDIFPQVRDTQVHEVYARVMAARRPEQFDFVSPILKRWTSFSVYPAGDGGISVYFGDISERKAAEREMIAAKEEAERANRAKSQFLASASHDLRQPVQSLFFFHEILATQLKTHPAAKVVATMNSALDALKSLLDGLLDISRLHAGTVTVTLSAFPVFPLLKRLRAENAPRAEAQGVTIRAVGSTAWVLSDQAQLERILRNLLDNALKYTPKGGEILIGCRRAEGSLRLQVIDTGPGIPPDRQEAVFEEFVQLGNPERDRAKGLGLGLAIVRHLGRLLGHEITLRSRVGRGTSFSVTVPLAGAGKEEGTPPGRVRVPHAGRLALVVDDEALILRGMRSILESWGWQVLAANSGAEALRLVSSVPRAPDVIIADYRLKGDETGLKVIREVAGVCGDAIPAVVLTGDTGPERIAECANSGFRLLHKPVDARALQDTLERLSA